MQTLDFDIKQVDSANQPRQLMLVLVAIDLAMTSTKGEKDVQHNQKPNERHRSPLD
jgi:hypothetical protein